jgi:hypothetical protein
MANQDAPFGFKPVRMLSGPFTGAVNKYRKEASVILGLGDPVVLTGSASAAGTNNATEDGIPLVTRASAGSGTITGVVAYVDIDSGTAQRSESTKHMAAADTGSVYVYDDPMTVFEIQEDSDTENMVVGDVGEGVDIVVANADTNTGLSNVELNSDNAGTGDQCQVLRLAQRPDNELGANAVWEVLINEHTYKAAGTMI